MVTFCADLDMIAVSTDDWGGAGRAKNVRIQADALVIGAGAGLGLRSILQKKTTVTCEIQALSEGS